jgi:hypothetical protein
MAWTKLGLPGCCCGNPYHTRACGCGAGVVPDDTRVTGPGTPGGIAMTWMDPGPTHYGTSLLQMNGAIGLLMPPGWYNLDMRTGTGYGPNFVICGGDFGIGGYLWFANPATSYSFPVDTFTFNIEGYDGRFAADQYPGDTCAPLHMAFNRAGPLDPDPTRNYYWTA